MPDPLEEIRRLATFDEVPVIRDQPAVGAKVKPAAAAKYQPAALGLWPLLGTLGAICLLWNTPVVYPIKLLVVFFHELSHALMALLTGGQVARISLDAMQGGQTQTLGGNSFLIASAGYLGSLLWGGGILSLATRLSRPRLLTGALAALLLLVSLVWIRPVFSFGMLFCLLSAAGLGVLAWRVPDRMNAFLLRVIGLTSLFYVPLDIFEDTVLGWGGMSDARLLAQLTLIPTPVWGVLWTAISAVAAWWFLRGTLPGKPKLKSR